MAVFLISISGWIAFILIGLEVLLPYLMRRGSLSRWLHVEGFFRRPYLERMWPHYWLGYLLLALSLLHSALPMRHGGLAGQNLPGIWLAAGGFAALLLQTVLGLYLEDRQLRERGRMRRWHYRLMFLVILTVGAHVWLNG
jgi:hypothetical protein